ncbi:hypothetical protein SDC9_192292 [bioreactor metagenome]|uniref:N-acetyltransferase domain-containing protein n=1 Tax=bioreactor metagenome TaxID=1076179 RepID=A0A645I0D0_9ZZZZ
MQQSFPPAEIRTYEGELALLAREDYRMLTVLSGKTIQAFIAEWRLDGFCFVEHFAVNPAVRGKGVGTDVFGTYLRQAIPPVVLEVEDAATQEAMRRIAFYERLNLRLSEIRYLQPKFRADGEAVPLRLMVYPNGVTEDALRQMKGSIFSAVYRDGE